MTLASTLSVAYLEYFKSCNVQNTNEVHLFHGGINKSFIALFNKKSKLRNKVIYK